MYICYKKKDEQHKNIAHIRLGVKAALISLLSKVQVNKIYTTSDWNRNDFISSFFFLSLSLAHRVKQKKVGICFEPVVLRAQVIPLGSPTKTPVRPPGLDFNFKLS